MKKVIYEKQTSLRDCGITCLSSLIKYYGGYVNNEYLREITKTTKEGVSAYSLILAGQLVGFDTKGIKGNIDGISSKDLPLIAHVVLNKSLGHFVIIYKMNSKYLFVMDPANGYKKVTKEEWIKLSTNVYLLFKPRSQILKQEKEIKFNNFLKKIIKKYILKIIIVLILSLIYTILNILVSYQFNFFLKAMSISNQKIIHYIFFFLLIIIILKEISNLFRNKLINYINHSLDKSLLLEIYNHIIRLPYLYFKTRNTGDILTRMTDVNAIKEAISKVFITLVIDVVMIIFLIYFLLHISIKLSIITFIISIFYMIIILVFNTLLANKFKTSKILESDVNTYLIETISSINTIKGMQVEDKIIEKLTDKYESLNKTNYKMFNLFYNETFIKDLIYIMGLLIIIYVGILDVLNNELSLGNLLTFYSLIIYYFTPLSNFFNMQIILKEANISFKRIGELLCIKEEIMLLDNKSVSKHLKGHIELKNLKYSYNGSDYVIKNGNMQINAKEKVLLYGVSGGGKSTLMKLLCKYIFDYEGHFLIDKRELYEYNLYDIRKRIMYVSQEEKLYTDSLYHNITLMQDTTYDKYLEVIKVVGLEELIAKSLLKHDLLIEEDGHNLSGGERQRIIIARALLKEADLYIFDESLSALDIKNERMILKKVLNYLKNKTVIIISHRFNNRDLYGKFILIEKGEIYEY